MTGRTLAATAALAATLAASSAPAQAVDSTIRARPNGACSSGLPGGGPTCPFERRLVVDLRAPGPAMSPELQAVVGLGASAGGVFALSLPAATARDSMLYAVVEVERDAAGSYRLRTGLAGPRAAAGACAGTASGHGSDMTFGAFLAVQVTQLVRCAQTQRSIATR